MLKKSLCTTQDHHPYPNIDALLYSQGKLCRHSRAECGPVDSAEV